jgi:peptide/nickel transport system substrate-binding protein
MTQVLGRRSATIAAVLIFGMTVACGRGRTETAGYTDPHALPEEPLVVSVPIVGTYGGRFVIGQISGPRTFNVMMANETSSTDITGLLYTSLAGFDNETQQAVPALAKSWDVAPDGLTWTFHLRRGAKFSDGQPITSADVLFGFELAYDETLHPSVQDLLIMNGRRFEVTAPDSHTVVIKTPASNGMLVSLASSVPVMPKHVLEPVFRAGGFASAYSVSTPPDQIVTSGPFRVAQYLPGEKTVVTRNPYYFGVDQENRRLPYLNEVVFLVVPDQDAADLKFRSAEIDGLDQVKPENYVWYEQNQQAGHFTLYDTGPGLSTNYFWFNLNKVRKATPGKRLGEPQVGALKYSWFNNVLFRRAVSMAVDRDAMIPSAFFGEAVKNWSQQTAGSKAWYNPDVVRYDHNLEESRRLLASLGWRDRDADGFLEDQTGQPVAFSLKTNSENRLRVSMANFIRDDLAKVGIKVTLAPQDFNTIITNIRDDFQYDAVLLGLQTGVPPDPGMGQNVWRSSGRTHNWNAQQPKPETPQEARIDHLMDVIVGSAEMTARLAAWREIEAIVNEQAWLIWLPTQIWKLPVSNRFENLRPSPIPHRILWNIDRVFVKPRS